MKVVILIGLILTLVGCAATHVTKPVKPKYAPDNYKPVGVIKYLNQGADFVIKERRESAFKDMYDACKGSYKIISESERADGGVGMAISSSTAMYGSTKYWYIRYECNS
jgi:hypothetical protein